MSGRLAERYTRGEKKCKKTKRKKQWKKIEGGLKLNVEGKKKYYGSKTEFRQSKEMKVKSN